MPSFEAGGFGREIPAAVAHPKMPKAMSQARKIPKFHPPILLVAC